MCLAHHFRMFFFFFWEGAQLFDGPSELGRQTVRRVGGRVKGADGGAVNAAAASGVRIEEHDAELCGESDC